MWKIEKIVSKGDYLYAVVKGHPNATKNNYVLHHRIVVENALGRLLGSDEVVHHINGNKKDNCITNLQVLNAKEHAVIHGKEKGRMYCQLKCPECGENFDRAKNATHLQRNSKYTCCSPKCRGRFSRRIQLHGLTTEVEVAISENIVLEYRKYFSDNSEETATTGSVETIRNQPETAKI